MGRLVVLHRRIDLASDDLYVPAAYLVFLHLVWLPCTVAAYILVPPDCQVHHDLRLYLIVYVALMAVELLVEVAILVLSMMGTVSRKGPRKYCSPLVHVHLLLTLFEMVFQSFGIWLVFTRQSTWEVPLDVCPTAFRIPTLTLLRLVVVWGIIAFCLYTIGLILFLAFSKTKHRTSNEMNKYTRLWQKRFGLLSRKKHPQTAASTEVMRDVATEFADFFRDVDWSVSDIACALILLKREQKKVREAVELNSLLRTRVSVIKKYESTSSLSTFASRGESTVSSVGGSTLSMGHSLDEIPLADVHMGNPHKPMSAFGEPAVTRDDIADVLHYAHYAEIVYNHAEYACLGPDIILRSSTHNDYFKTPYMVCFDHDHKSVVVAIRGTYSTIDLLVDLKIDLEPLLFEGMEEEGTTVSVEWCHSGVLKTARNIIKDIRETDVLGMLKGGKGEKEEYKDYSVVVCGHSLGAGVAALVAYYLHLGGYPVQCYAYEPPGCLITAQAASFMNPFVTSVVVGDDFVARLGRNSMEILKADIDRVLRTCNVPKWRVFGSALDGCCCCTYGRRRKLRWEVVKEGRWRRLHGDDVQYVVDRVRSLPRRWRTKMVEFMDGVEEAAQYG
ncbi:hypothetical protein HK104_002114, partial [Borealophlyctis nickersoniae]